MKRKRLVSAVLCAAMVASMFTGCGSSGDKTTSKTTSKEASEESGKLEKTTLKMPLAGAVHIFHEIAEREGYYEDEGLTIDIQPVEQGGEDAFTALTSGKVDFISDFGTNAPLQQIGSGADLQIFAGYMLEGAVFLAGRKGEEWNGIESLKGKTVCGEASSYYITGPYMDAGGDPIKDIKWTPLAETDAMLAVSKGEADYTTMGTYHIYNVTQSDDLEIVAYADDLLDNYSCCRVVTTTKWLEENPNTAKALMRVWLRAQAYFEAHRDELVPMFAEITGNSEDHTRAWLTSEHLTLQLDPTKGAILRAWNYLMDMGFFEKGAADINVEDHINTTIYKEALDECAEKYGDENPEFYDKQLKFYEATDVNNKTGI